MEREKYGVVLAPTGKEGFFLVNAQEFDLVILDLMLPGRDGLQVLATLRKRDCAKQQSAEIHCRSR